MRRSFCFSPSRFVMVILLASLFIAEFLLSACKHAPVPEEEPIPGEPSASLIFEGIEAEGPEELNLLFTLRIENPLPSGEGARPYAQAPAAGSAGRVKLESWRAEINGREVNSGLSMESAESFPLAAADSGVPATASFPLGLNMDMATLAAEGHAPADDYKVNLIIVLDFPSVRKEVSVLASFPGIRAPEFSINAIAILKAELINTRFRVAIKIDNPNPFPMELSAFNYELYGNGRLWADGTERNIIRIPAKSSLEGNLFLMMNFINMKRDLLDQIIKLEDVNYRFAGEVRVSTGLEYLPVFTSGFDLSGYSQVLEN